MNPKTHKILSSVFVACLALGGLGALMLLVNLNQLEIFSVTAFKVWLAFCVFVVLFYDLHFKSGGNWKKIISDPEYSGKLYRALSRAFYERVKHLHSWHFLHLWANYLLLPSFIFWSTATLLYVNMGYYKFQAVIILLSSAALVVNYWYLKEVFYRKKEQVDTDIFIKMSVVKIYASCATYGASVVLIRRFCLEWQLLALGVFALTFFLIYQALFQHRLIYLRNLLWTILISFIMAAISFGVLKFWGYNYFTAAVFMTICYNLMWGAFHYHLDKALTRRALLEILVISLVLGYMIFEITNFKARLLDGCAY